eukprot:scaffold37421_cov39-Phaeocystis_antarctica.AAC.2
MAALWPTIEPYAAQWLVLLGVQRSQNPGVSVPEGPGGCSAYAVHACGHWCEAEVELAAAVRRAALDGAHVIGHEIARLQRLVAAPRRDSHGLAALEQAYAQCMPDLMRDAVTHERQPPRAERAQQISDAERDVIAGGVPPRGEQALLSRLEAAADALSLRAAVAVVPRDKARARGGVDEAVARAKLLPVKGVAVHLPRTWCGAQHA